jgi:hypothetical protein
VAHLETTRLAAEARQPIEQLVTMSAIWSGSASAKPGISSGGGGWRPRRPSEALESELALLCIARPAGGYQVVLVHARADLLLRHYPLGLVEVAAEIETWALLVC